MEPTGNETIDKIEALLHLLRQGEDQIKILQMQNNAVLVVGNTGSGISTFIKWIADSYARLESINDANNLGQYYIKDMDENVITSHFKSHTMYPAFRRDGDGTIFFDFPGFISTREAVQDIATISFIKTVVGNVKNVKMVFLVSYASLTNVESRYHFKNLINHVMTLMDNFKIFRKSIMLVVSKITVEEKFTYEDIISSIVLNLERTRDELGKERHNENTDASIQFIDTILYNSRGAYPYIQLFRSPHQVGALNRIALMQDNRLRLIAALKRLDYASKDDFDFRFFVPNQSLASIGILLNEINQQILVGIKTYGQDVQKCLRNLQNHVFDIVQLYHATVSAYTALEEAKKAGNIQETPELCVQKIVYASLIPCNGTSHQGLLHAMRYAQHSLFLYTFSRYPIDKSFKCADGLDSALEYLLKSQKWYKFLVQLYRNSLTSYEVQSNPGHSRCNDLATLVFQGSIRNNLSDVLENQLKQCDPQNEYEYKNIIIDEPKFNALRNLLNLTTNRNTITSCESDTLLIRAQFLQLSEIQKLQNQTCRTQPRSIHVFVGYTLFFDTDLQIIDEVWLSILAQTWDIRGDGIRKIELLGKHGEHQPQAENGTTPPPIVVDGQVVNGTSQPGTPGKHGLPGFPGTNGGHFFGVGDTFINLQNLIVSSTGGDGGPGQQGGNGGRGQNGRDAYNDLNIGSSDYPKQSQFRRKDFPEKGFLGIRIAAVEKYRLFGMKGARGGNAGDGGVGGKGASAGILTLIPISDVCKIEFKTLQKNGKNGEGGAAGTAGEGGLRGLNYWVHIEYRGISTFLSSSDFPKVIENQEGREDSTPDPGLNGTANKNSNGAVTPVQPVFTDRAVIVNDYKAFLREIMYRSTKESLLREYLNNIEKSGAIRQRTKRIATYISTPDSIDHAVTLKYANPKISAAQNLKSPINTAVNLVADFFVPLKLIYPTFVTNFKLIKNGIQSIFEEVTLSQPNAYSTSTTTKLNKFDVNGALVIADLLIRCVTKVKPYDYTERAINASEVRATTLNIITAFQAVLNHLIDKLNFQDQSLEFDPISLISKLDDKLGNRDYQNLVKIMFQSIDKNSHLDYVNFEKEMQPKINKILKRQSENNSSTRFLH